MDSSRFSTLQTSVDSNESSPGSDGDHPGCTLKN